MNIGILASGGDGAGMNYCLYHLCKNLKGHNLFLFNGGYSGLIDNNTVSYDLKFLQKHKNDGGIVIKTSRCPEFETKEGIKKALDTINKNNIQVVIVMGGNGSLQGAKELRKNNVDVLFIPCSIDNDIVASEYSIGFDSACARCVEYINTVSDTMKSFNRTCIYEVMGRHCDKIAKQVAKAVCADYLYIQKNQTFEDCLQKVKQSNQTSPIVVVQENLIDIKQLKEYFLQNGTDSRACVIGHYQRGGNPTKLEKCNANKLATYCANLVKHHIFNQEIIIKDNVATSVEI